MVAEVLHGASYRFTDLARFSLAHGGKDRHPYPVPLKVYDETIRVLKSAVQSAKLGRDEDWCAEASRQSVAHPGTRRDRSDGRRRRRTGARAVASLRWSERIRMGCSACDEKRVPVVRAKG